MLRGHFSEYDDESGQYVFQPYYVGTLKSFSNQKGYGFLSCDEVYEKCGSDVFIHQKLVPVPWQLGTPVEFAVVLNAAGKPQASDVKWLPVLPKPRLPVSPTANIFSPNGPNGIAPQPSHTNQTPQTGYGAPQAHLAPVTSVTTAPAEGTSAREQAILADQLAADRSDRRYIGTLKSFSTAKGYGFFACPEFQRDVYLEKSLLPQQTRWELHQTVEFSVNFNTRGQPQARDVNWAPVPLVPSENKQARKTHSEGIRQKLHKLLQLLHDNDLEQALITAIDSHGDAKGEVSTTEPDADYVVFVLDRTDEQHVNSQVKDFVKMLLLLMLAKMLKKASLPKRVETLNQWMQFVAQALNPESVAEHFASVVDQVQATLKTAVATNPAVGSSEEKYESLIKHLREKVSP